MYGLYQSQLVFLVVLFNWLCFNIYASSPGNSLHISCLDGRSEFQIPLLPERMIILQHVKLILVLINCSSIFTNQNIVSLLDLMTSVHMFCSSVFTKQNRNVIIRFNDIYPHNRFSQYPSVLLYTTSLNSSLKLCR